MIYKIVILFVFLSACEVDLFEPQGAIPLEPVPFEYAVWWGEVGRCLADRRVHDIDYWYVPGVEWFWWEGLRANAVHQSGRITIAESWLQNEWLVKHEQVHARGYSHPLRRGEAWRSPGDSLAFLCP